MEVVLVVVVVHRTELLAGLVVVDILEELLALEIPRLLHHPKEITAALVEHFLHLMLLVGAAAQVR
jgi:hypothetical protein